MSESPQLVKIEYLDSSPQLAREIANGVLYAYQDRARDLWREKRNDALDVLRMQLKDQEDKVEEARLRALDLAERYRITPQSAVLVNENESELNKAVREAEILLVSAADREEASKTLQGPDGSL